MVNPADAQKLKLVALIGIGLLLAIFLGSQLGQENYGYLLLGTLIISVAGITFFSGRFFWVLTIASSFLTGTFPILRGSFTPFQILMAIGVSKFLIEDIVLKRTPIKKPALLDLVLISAFMAIITMHGVHDRFGMRFLGSNIWGGRNYVNVYVGLAAFFVVQSIPVRPRLWSKLPYVILAVTTFDLIIALITTVFPASIYKIYPFYSAVSTAGVEEIVAGAPGETERVGAFGNFGFILVTMVFSSIPLTRVLTIRNFRRALILFIGFAAVLYSGFRSAVMNTLLAIFSTGIRDLKVGVVLLAPLIAIVLLGLSFLNSYVVALPKQVQRGLTFLPGDWDSRMARDAESSNDFRRRVWTTWAREYFPVHPWLGRGFGFRRQFAQQTVYKYNPNWDRDTVEVGNIHNGFLASLDTFGILGTIFFVIWNLRLLAKTFQMHFDKSDPSALTLRFIALYLAVSIISYWIGAQDVGSFLPREFALAGVFFLLNQSADGEADAAQLVRRDIERRLVLPYS